jgi:2-polyprenyl-3-methyl-5-hydroxy-6-metoxy-1,4-benzoquinol methylase
VNPLTQRLLSDAKILFKDEQSPFLAFHSNNDGVVMGHIRTALRYITHLSGGTFLDWGCHHALDSWVVRQNLPSAKLHGCDIIEPVGKFHAAAGLDYRKLSTLSTLPYPDEMFDSVIGSGVIEHVINPSDSLKELHRVLKTDGTLVLTYIPNRFSVTETILSLLGGHAHSRCYTRSSVRALLLNHGFKPVEIGFHEIVPTLTSASVGWMRRISLLRWIVTKLSEASPFLDRVWPLNFFGQNIYAIAKRVEQIH